MITLVVALSMATPVPPPSSRPRPIVARELVGSWKMTLGGTYWVVLGPDGDYCCASGDYLWRGKWSCHRGTITIEEADQGEHRSTDFRFYQFVLERNARGFVGRNPLNQFSFALER